ADPLYVTLGDVENNPLTALPVTFTLQGGPATGTFAGGATVLTDATGTATANTLTANTVAGGYLVTAFVGDVAVNTFTLTNTPGPAARLQVPAPAGRVSGRDFGVPVGVLAAYGTTVTGYPGPVHFPSSDPAATFPADYTFVAGDLGVHTFTGGFTLWT